MYMYMYMYIYIYIYISFVYCRYRRQSLTFRAYRSSVGPPPYNLFIFRFVSEHCLFDLYLKNGLHKIFELVKNKDFHKIIQIKDLHLLLLRGCLHA